MLFGLAFLLAASVGHVAFLVYCLNRIYSIALPHRLLKFARLICGLLALVGMLLFALVLGLDPLANLGTDSQGIGHTVLAGYAAVCAVIGVGIVPIDTCRRLWRARPAALLSNHTRTVNVAERLGYMPAGCGRYRLLARLPGNEVFQVDFAERTLWLPQLPPEWEGLSILHISDLHFKGCPDRPFFDCVMDLCRDWEPDLVALTGDLVDSSRHHRWIVPVFRRLRWRVGAFAILGNHDSWREPARTRRRLGRAGLRVLANTWDVIEVRGLPMAVIGHEGPWFRPAPDMSGCTAETFRLLLSHTPDNIRWAQKHQVDLMLAGHNHGGQIRLPLVGSVFSPSRYGRRYDMGTFFEPPTLLHVSRGLGGQHPVRYNCRPEVAKLILRRFPPSTDLTSPDPRG
jgi:predicted MPP superfamily phosphohydrolase